MDIGLGRFLDKFEEKFGSRASKYLLLTIAVGVYAIVIRLVFGLVSPVVIFIQKSSWGDLKEYLVTTLFPIAVGYAVFLLIFTLVARVILWGYDRFTRARVDRILERRAINRIKKKFNKEKSAELNQMFEEFKAKGDEATRRVIDEFSRDIKAREDRLQYLASKMTHLLNGVELFMKDENPETVILSLREALENGDLEQFIRQHENGPDT